MNDPREGEIAIRAVPNQFPIVEIWLNGRWVKLQGIMQVSVNFSGEGSKVSIDFCEVSLYFLKAQSEPGKVLLASGLSPLAFVAAKIQVKTNLAWSWLKWNLFFRWRS